MSYYQVILKFKNSESSFKHILVDASENELLSRIVKPYRKGSNLFHNSTVIDCNDIEKIIIILTRNKDEQERKKINDESLKRIDRMNRESDSLVIMSPGVGYDPEDILEAGEEVTEKYIKGPPGYSKTGALQEFIYNPWIMAIGTGLIIAAIVAWMKWN
jgi:hypothetical protein